MKKITIKDVARELNCSVSLVSKALNGYEDVSSEKRKTIIDGAREMGYIADSNAANLARKHNLRIALLMSANEDDEFIDEITMTYTINAFREINRLGYEPFVIFFDYIETMSEEELLRYLLSKGIGAVIIFGFDGKHNLKKVLEYDSIKKVILDGEYTNNSTTCITIDNFAAQYDIINTFCDNESNNKILYIAGSLRTFVGLERYNAFKWFEKEHPEKIMHISICHFDGKRAYEEVLKLEDNYDVIICASDMMAVSAARASIKKGSKPLILGFDGIKLINYSPLKIVSVKQDFAKASIDSVTEAVSLINGNPPKMIFEECKFVESIDKGKEEK